ncbi:GTPase HflX [Gammaproteobacteria bacterium 53_120_T64]|nr:GTPase HflX [Gammaproteobacteria bacterium 53_120_T64]
MFFDRPESGELSVLVHLNLNSEREPEDPREFEELAISAGGDPIAFITGSRDVPTAKFFVGTGKLEEIKQEVDSSGAGLVIFNHNLTPSQERNIEHVLACRVLDRTGLILDIFAQRAQTHEGKLQVELAQLEHMSTRLIRGWTHLERQKGGIGLRGPGETQLETDRRLLRVRIKSILKRLVKVRVQREQGRRSRRRAEVPTVSLVGYTNAGKSTLFNRLTGADVYAADQLFATLDPTMRAFKVPEVGSVIFADTVGFISHLPHKLVEAFRATLDEASNATLLLHIIDASAEQRLENVERVDEVLNEIGAGDIPVLKIYNKIDLLDGVEPRIERNGDGKPLAIWLSAKDNIGIDLLPLALRELLSHDQIQGVCALGHELARFRAQLFEAGAVLKETVRDDGVSLLEVSLPKVEWLRLLKAAGLCAEQVLVQPVITAAIAQGSVPE